MCGIACAILITPIFFPRVSLPETLFQGGARLIYGREIPSVSDRDAAKKREMMLCLEVPHSLSLFLTFFSVSNRWRFSRRCRVIRVSPGMDPHTPHLSSTSRSLFVLSRGCCRGVRLPLAFRRHAAAANINPRRNSPRSAADTPLRPSFLSLARAYPSPPPPPCGLNARNLWPRHLIFRTLSSKTLDAVA